PISCAMRSTATPPSRSSKPCAHGRRNGARGLAERDAICLVTEPAAILRDAPSALLRMRSERHDSAVLTLRSSRSERLEDVLLRLPATKASPLLTQPAAGLAHIVASGGHRCRRRPRSCAAPSPR